jgi:endogenous inhibitor of DNA gyrase (YacG/DUF329 family)
MKKDTKTIKCDRCGTAVPIDWATLSTTGKYCSDLCAEEYERPHPKAPFKGNK